MDLWETLCPRLAPGSQPGRRGWAGLGLTSGRSHIIQPPSRGQSFRRILLSPLAAPSSYTRDVCHGPDPQPGLLNLPVNKIPPVFQVLERLPGPPTLAPCHPRRLRNNRPSAQTPPSQVGSSYLLSCSRSRLSHPSPPTSAGSSLLNTMSLWPHLGAPHALPGLQPAQLSPPLPPGPLLSANPCSDSFLLW